jgi:hypothetical protein
MNSQCTSITREVIGDASNSIRTKYGWKEPVHSKFSFQLNSNQAWLEGTGAFQI